MKRSYLTFCMLLILGKTFCQTNSSDNYLSWSSEHKLTINDFGIKTNTLQSSSSSAQFSMQFEINGFGFMPKNFNKKVHNYFIKSASWIDTTYDINLFLRYQQTLFDICKIYTRRFRKGLKENKRKVVRDNEFVNELNAKAMTDFANRRVEYDTETKSGTDTEKQLVWEARIQKELKELKDFSNE